jgi:hypothetical protein
MDLGTKWLCQAVPEFDGAVAHLKSVHQLPAGSPILERGSPADRVVFVDAGDVRIELSMTPFPVTRLVTQGAVLGLYEASRDRNTKSRPKPTLTYSFPASPEASSLSF